MGGGHPCLTVNTNHAKIMICKKCGKDFPSSIVIDNKRKSLSKRKYCLECSTYGSNNRKPLEKYMGNFKQCSKCDEILLVENFSKSNKKAYSYCKSCANIRAKQLHKEVKAKCVEYKGGKCQKCGYSKCPLALEFHHIESDKKEFNVTGRKSFTGQVREELDKCILVCSNCHREIHYELNLLL